MKVNVIGCGAMGTLFGTAMLKSGHTVQFFDTYVPFIEQIKARGTAKLDDEELKVDVKLLDGSPSEKADLIIIFVKATQTESVVDLIQKSNMVSPSTVFLTCQGGFSNGRIIQSIASPGHVLVGCTTSYSKTRGAMDITAFKILDTVVWPYGVTATGVVDEIVSNMVKQLNEHKIKLTTDAITDIWKMQLYYVTSIAVSAVTNKSFGGVYETESGRILIKQLIDEFAAVALAYQVNFTVEMATQAIEGLVKSSGEHFGSMNADLKAKRKTEIDATAGELILMAGKKDIKVPATDVVWRLVKVMEE